MSVHQLAAALFVRDASYQFLASVQSLLAAEGVAHILVGSPDGSLLTGLAIDDRVETIVARSADELVNAASARWKLPVAACDEPVLVATDAFGPALHAIETDLRVAVVCMWSNAGGYLSFPNRNTPGAPRIDNLDEHAVGHRLRNTAPAQRPLPIPVAHGPLSIISRSGITAAGPLQPTPFDGLDVSLAEFSQRVARRGFVTLLDPSTLALRPFDLAPQPHDLLARHDVRAWLSTRHPFFTALYDHDRNDPESTIGIAHAAARSKVMGLSVLIDGTCLGPLEMGTQVNVVALVTALAANPDVREVTLSVPGDVPAYAAAALRSGKVRTVRSPKGEFPTDVQADIVHRPYQPDTLLPMNNWRRAARRVCVTLQDLIAYRNGSYHPDGFHWMKYRRELATASSQSDMIVAISHDVAQAIHDERLRIDADRLFVVGQGTDHLTGDEPARPPLIALQHGLAAREFLFVLGTNYSHKNRDLAVRAWNELRRRGHDLALVMVGAAVPYGSSRHYEAEAFEPGEQAISLPDVTSEERNWLLRHAVAAVYPTSAEGFGFIPFEAARFGTPTVSVSFGPLREVSPDPEIAATSWDPADLADAIEVLVESPARREAAVRQILAAGANYTWDHTAALLVDAYRAILEKPMRS